MKTNKWILGGLMAMAITACTSDELVENTNPTQGKKVTVTAYAPGDAANSRVSFADNNTSKVTLSWKETENFSVVYHTTAQTFSKTTAGNTFTGILPTPATSPASYYAVYPALEEEEEEEEATLTAANTVPFDLSTQTGALDESKTYMRASSTDGLTYNFVHCTAILKATFRNVNFTGNTKIKEVKVLLPNDNATGTINLADDGAMTGATGNNIITINYPEPVVAATAAYIYLPPMAKDKKTLTFVVTTEDEKKYTGTLAGSNDNHIVAGNIYKAEITVASANFLTFTAENDDQSLKMSTTVSGLQYSTDGLTWKNLGTSTVDFVNKQLFLRGQNSYGTNTAKISFGNSKVKVACSGDIRTLVNYTNYTTITEVGSAKFRDLFKECTELTSAPELPFATLASNCYYGMFEGCTSLVEAPELPATTLAEKCYKYMFEGCTSLVTAHELPATTLAEECCYNMFAGCTSLVTAPKLSATTLAEKCYYNMFFGCTSLVTAPKLPATTLAENCYERMFEGCTSLESAPELPATTLAAGCYYCMFSGCTSLETAPELPATTLAERCYSYMFGYCTSLVTAPELPATTLAAGCYYSMFGHCTSLQTSPVLSPKEVNSNSLSYMFQYCRNLKEITWLADGNLLNENNSGSWVLYVASKGSFYKLKDKYVSRGSDACPSGWDVVDYEEQEK